MYKLYFSVLIFLLPLVVLGNDSQASLNGYYVEEGNMFYACVKNDTLEFLFLEQLSMRPRDFAIAEEAICNMEHVCGDLFEINCFEQSDSYIINGLVVCRDTIPSLPSDSIKICFVLDSTLQRSSETDISIEVKNKIGTQRKQATLNTLFDIYYPDKSESDVFSFTFYPYQFNSDQYGTMKYPKSVELWNSLTPYVEVPLNGANMITVKLNGLSADIFRELYISGAYVFCDGKTLRWRNITFVKDDDNDYVHYPRRGRKQYNN